MMPPTPIAVSCHRPSDLVRRSSGGVSSSTSVRGLRRSIWVRNLSIDIAGPRFPVG